MYKHFWATQYAKGELYPAGWYPNLHEGGDGLPRWTEKNRSLDNENIVVWYTLNYHHCRARRIGRFSPASMHRFTGCLRDFLTAILPLMFQSPPAAACCDQL